MGMIKFKADEVAISGGIDGNAISCVDVQMELRDSQASRLLSEIWSFYGDDWIVEQLRREGFAVTKAPR